MDDLTRKYFASRPSPEHYAELFRLIHKRKKVPYTYEKEVQEAYDNLQHDYGYSIGDENDPVDEIPEAGKLIDTIGNDRIAVYWNRDRITLVGDVYGPWAVDIEV